jgi:hypothetical protein
MDLTVAVRRRRQAGLSSLVPFEDHLVIYIDSFSLNFGLIMHEQLVIVLYLVPKPVNAYIYNTMEIGSHHGFFYIQGFLLNETIAYLPKWAVLSKQKPCVAL